CSSQRTGVFRTRRRPKWPTTNRRKWIRFKLALTVFLGHNKIRSQQGVHGGRQIPLPMHMKLAARMQQPVHYQELQHFLPRDASTPAAETTVPKLLQAQLLPQLARQPATAEKARTSQLEPAHFHLQTVDRIGRNLAVVRKQTQVLIILLLFIKHRQRLLPCRSLMVVDLTEIENRSLSVLLEAMRGF